MTKTGSIIAIFKRLGKGKVIYSHRMHTKTETKANTIACRGSWCKQGRWARHRGQ
ncbi:hypothetical protein F5148DRAFT_473455 [Russula earlei]|uniref:Uncharacterized protein n=1 Tax=Russula earlei TaxID=71964 RepID=A0ACC0UGY4_9AGAM|nr:hypothetical protein F5148DRAFT_473455 [Russula earlei]